MHVIVYVNHLLMRFLSCNYFNKQQNLTIIVTCNFFINSVFLMSLSQSVVHVMASLQPWFSMQSIVRAALNTNPRVFVTYNSGSLRYM